LECKVSEIRTVYENIDETHGLSFAAIGCGKPADESKYDGAYYENHGGVHRCIYITRCFKLKICLYYIQNASNYTGEDLKPTVVGPPKGGLPNPRRGAFPFGKSLLPAGNRSIEDLKRFGRPPKGGGRPQSVLLAEKHKLFLSGLAYAPKGSIGYIKSSMV